MVAQTGASVGDTSAATSQALPQTRIIAILHPGDPADPCAVELINLALAVDVPGPVEDPMPQRDGATPDLAQAMHTNEGAA